MTDKQIIIDGIDVSGCILRRRKEPNCTVCNGYSSKVFEFDCSDFKNCYFKQLARKTQECEEYKKRAVYFKDVNKQLGYKYLTIKQECEEMKKQLMQKDEVDMFFNTPLEGWSSNPCGICEYKGEYDRYREALEEIKKVCIEDTRIFADGTEVRYDALDKILDIINKAKGEGNE